MHTFVILLFTCAAGLVVALGAAFGLAPVLQVLTIGAAGLVLAVMSKGEPPVGPEPPLLPGPDRELPSGFGRALLNQMPAPLIVISASGRVTYSNPAAHDILPKVAPGTHFLSMIRAPAFVDAVSTILSTREDLAFTFTMQTGRERFFSARASFFPATAGSEFGEADQIIMLIEDRSQDKALLQTRSDFVANASHELRTPLASILGYIETLQGHAKDDPDAREKFLSIMMSQANRMRRLVDDLMSLSRIEMSAHLQPTDVVPLYEVTAEAAAALFPQANASDVILQIELPPENGPQVRGDRDQLAQVVVNLVDNAIKYGGHSTKVRIVVSDEDPRYPRHTGISVIDQGPGIARENIPRLTERFFRVSAAQSKDMGGTGLGLAITKHILARHRGALDIRSGTDVGSTFTFWLPELEES
ncbi:MAG: ATP-binding protein, partial [Pseudomonadota bacterium]